MLKGELFKLRVFENVGQDWEGLENIQNGIVCVVLVIGIDDEAKEGLNAKFIETVSINEISAIIIVPFCREWREIECNILSTSFVNTYRGIYLCRYFISKPFSF